MADRLCLSVSAIGEIFSQVVSEFGGEVRESSDDGLRLLARAVLPEFANVATGDRVQNGVALSYAQESLQLHPYVYRLLCSNGMIGPSVTRSKQIDHGEFRDRESIHDALRAGVRACTSPRFFGESVGKLKDLWHHPADMALLGLSLRPALSRASERGLLTVLLDLISIPGTRPTMYDALNVTTAFARDLSDKREKWDLEQYAGRVLLDPTKWLVPGFAAEIPEFEHHGIPIA